MNIAKQHSEFKIRLNKINSNHYEDLKPNQIDSFLDSAALFICNHWGEIGQFQKTQFGKDMFGTLLIKYPDQPELSPLDNGNGQYEINLNQLKYNYLHLDGAYVQCGNLVIPVTMITRDEDLKLNDYSQRPNFKWKRLLGVIAKSSTLATSSLYIYSDVDLTTKKVRIEYVKEPKKVFFGGYDTIEYINCQRLNHNPSNPTADCSSYYNVTTYPVDSDLPATYHDLQVDVAIWLATGKTENQFLNNFIINKISSLPK